MKYMGKGVRVKVAGAHGIGKCKVKVERVRGLWGSGPTSQGAKGCATRGGRAEVEGAGVDEGRHARACEAKGGLGQGARVEEGSGGNCQDGQG